MNQQNYISKKHSLILFFALAFLFSWAIHIPEALASAGFLPFHMPAPLLLLSGFGPALAGIAAAWREAGGSGVRQLFSRMTRWRIGLRWYGVALLGPAFILALAVGLEMALGGSPPPLLDPPLRQALGMTTLPTGLFFISLLTYSMLIITGEELGWRGFALPRLQVEKSDLAAGVILGVLWGLWHLPLVWVPAAQAAVSELPLWAFLIDITATSVLYVWLFNHSRGSVLLVTIAHAANNTAAAFLMPAETTGLRLFLLVVGIRLALVALLLLHYRNGDLGRTSLMQNGNSIEESTN